MSVVAKRIVWGFGLIVALNILLLFSGYRILLSEERGVEYTPYSRIGGIRKVGDTLTCTYWTGRSVRKAKAGAYDWKPDECPFVLKSKYLK